MQTSWQRATQSKAANNTFQIALTETDTTKRHQLIIAALTENTDDNGQFIGSTITKSIPRTNNPHPFG